MDLDKCKRSLKARLCRAFFMVNRLTNATNRLFNLPISALYQLKTSGTIITSVNQEFIITVVSQPTKGFEWRATYAKSMLQLVESTAEGFYR